MPCWQRPLLRTPGCLKRTDGVARGARPVGLDARQKKQDGLLVFTAAPV
jgi:hypothetical protein